VPSLRLEGLAFAWSDAVPLIDAVHVVLPAGFTGLVGENGAGKTSLLRLLAGALTPAAGRVRTDPPDARVVLCPQEVGAPGELEAELAAREDGEARRVRATLSLDGAGLARWPTLSPGERKRWQLGAALAADPAVLLLDEPYAGFDWDTYERFWDLTAERRAAGRSVLVISHFVADQERFDRLEELRDGRIEPQ
jgi:ABC-type multidrug transport system ATPase subunit